MERRSVRFELSVEADNNRNDDWHRQQPPPVAAESERPGRAARNQADEQPMCAARISSQQRGMSGPTGCLYTVGYWMSRKKSNRLRWPQMVEYCRARGMDLVELDLERSLDEQGPFDAIIHKVTDIWTANASDERWKRLQAYERQQPHVPLLDPLASMRILCDRAVQYQFLQSIAAASEGGIRPPASMCVSSSDAHDNRTRMQMFGLQFPVVCKPIKAHGARQAHTMCLVFNLSGLCTLPADQLPMVAQSFVCHDAQLAKVFVIGDAVFVERRPSLKNFVASDAETIWFDSQDISKADSSCDLTKQRQQSSTVSPAPHLTAQNAQVQRLVRDIRNRTGLNLFGVDVIADNVSGALYAIDLNLFPGYDGVCNVHELLYALIRESITGELRVRRRKHRAHSQDTNAHRNHLLLDRPAKGDSGLGTSESEVSDAAHNSRKHWLRRSDLARKSASDLDKDGFVPDWGRVKLYYGIPKPMQLKASASTAATPAAVAAIAAVTDGVQPEEIATKDRSDTT